MKTIRVVFTGASALLCMAVSSQAADETPSSHKLSDFSIGEIVSGDSVNLDSLQGKVVALEMWGYR